MATRGGAGVGGAPRAVSPWRRRSRLRSASHRHRAREGCLRLRWRRAQPLARSAPARRRPSLEPREGFRQRPASRHRRRGRAVPRHRRRDRPPPELASRQQDPAEAAAHFGWFAYFAAMDVRHRGAKTQERLGWRPKQARARRRPRPASLFRGLTGRLARCRFRFGGPVRFGRNSQSRLAFWVKHRVSSQDCAPSGFKGRGARFVTRHWQ